MIFVDALYPQYLMEEKNQLQLANESLPGWITVSFFFIILQCVWFFPGWNIKSGMGNSWTQKHVQCTLYYAAWAWSIELGITQMDTTAYKWISRIPTVQWQLNTKSTILFMSLFNGILFSHSNPMSTSMLTDSLFSLFSSRFIRLFYLQPLYFNVFPWYSFRNWWTES